MTIFKEVVENRINDSYGRPIMLIKYTKGEAKELVMNSIHQPPRKGYQIAKMLLEKDMVILIDCLDNAERRQKSGSS